MRKATPVGLKEVAAVAGVSIAAASHALRPGRRAAFVSAATQARIVKIAARLGYRVNPFARGLRGDRRYSIAIVCGVLRDRSAISAAESIIAYLSETPYAGVVATCGQVADIEDYILRHLDSRSHDAVIFIRDDLRVRPSLLNSLQRKKVRVAAIMPASDRLGKMPLAYLDRPRAAVLLVEALAKAGHRRIDYVRPGKTPPALCRAVEKFARESGLSLRWIDSPSVHHNEADAFKAGVELVRADLRFSKATGVAVFTENMAVGVAHGFRLFGLGVPEQKSIVGYGDLTWQEANEPPLDTVSHPIREIGQSIARQTIAWIESGYADAAAERKQFSPCYHPRESMCKPPSSKLAKAV